MLNSRKSHGSESHTILNFQESHPKAGAAKSFSTKTWKKESVPQVRQNHPVKFMLVRSETWEGNGWSSLKNT